MAITLGAVSLNDHISWRGYHNSPGVPGSEVSTLGGNTVVNRLMGNTTDIILEAIEEDNIRKGYFLKEQLDALRVYRDSGTVITLDYHGEEVDVIIRSNGILVEKALWQSTFDTTEKWIGSITCKRNG